MLTRDVAKGIHRIEDAYTNWYLVEEGDRLTVVDCGVPASWSSLAITLTALGRRTTDIEAVILTHAHFDHLGFAERARQELGVPVWLHTNDYALAKNPAQYAHPTSRLKYLTKPGALPIFMSLMAARAFWPTPLKEVRRFTDADETLPVPGSPRVLPTPGHTLGHCAFHFPDRDVVLTGDAIVTLGPYTGSPGPQIVEGAATADPERNLATLDAIAETGATMLLTGHGEPWAKGADEAVRLARLQGIS